MAGKTKEKTARVMTEDNMKKRGQMRDIWKRFRQSKLAMFGLVLVLIIIFSAVFANFIAPYGPADQSYADRLQYPSLKHLMGTDNYGRDLFSRLLYGGRISLLVSLMSLVISLGLGGLFGCVAGFFGGAVDTIIMRIMDLLMAIPGMLMSVAVAAMLGTSMFDTAMAVAVGGIAPCSRMIRAVIMTIRDQEYVEAARARGSRSARIIIRQILPNSLSPIIVDATLRVGANIMQISGLSFIGLGVQPPTPEWGSILNTGREFVLTFWPMITFPGIMIMLTMFGFNVMGDGLRDALDPKLKR